MSALGGLGEYIREQRTKAQVSLRQLAEQAGVSNPYLSQIERGLRKPSAEVLQQIAAALRISTPVMYLRAGLLEDRESQGVLDAIAHDPVLTDRQRQILTEVYESFCRENQASTVDKARPAMPARRSGTATARRGTAEKTVAADGPRTSGAAKATPRKVAKAAPKKAPVAKAPVPKAVLETADVKPAVAKVTAVKAVETAGGKATGTPPVPAPRTTDPTGTTG